MREIGGTYVKRISSARGGTFYHVRINWRTAARPDITLGIFTNENDADHEAARIAQLLHLGEPPTPAPLAADTAAWHHAPSK